MSKKLKDKNVIGVCCAALRQLSVLEPLSAICRTANAIGLRVHIFQSFEEFEEDTDLSCGEESVYDLINYDMLCGLVVFGERIKDQTIIRSLVDKAMEHGIPVVSFDQKQKDCFNLTFEYADAFEQIVRHLVEHHHFTKYFVMAGLKDNAFSDERLDVIRRVFAENGLTLKEEDIAYGGFWELPAKAVMEDFFAKNRELPEAFIALNDTMATVIIDELQKRGYNVPKDTTVTGFDGIELAENFIPKITTAKQQFEDAGRIVVELIDDYRNGKITEVCDVQVPFQMQLSQSCGCESIDFSHFSRSVRGLETNYENSKRFAFYMDQMTRRMTAKSNMESMLNNAASYAQFVDTHDYKYLCVKKSFMQYDDAYFNRLSKINPVFTDYVKKDMVLLFKSELDEFEVGSMTDFCGRDLLPNLEEVHEKVKNLLFISIHVGKDVYGYMAANFILGNKDIYKTRMYSDKLANALLLIKQKSLLTNSNRELEKAKNELEMMYILDPMTGIYNRRGFYQKYEEFLVKQQGGYVSVVSVDLDRLKPLNDTYGHQEGDFAIKSLGEALKEMVGENGLCARFGGDEFVAILHHDKKMDDITEVLWNDMVERLEQKRRALLKPYAIRTSLGVVQEPMSANMDIDALISKSDKLLYEMKRLHHEQEDEALEKAQNVTQSILNHPLFEALSEASDYVYVYVLDMNTLESRWSKNFVSYFGVPQEYILDPNEMWISHVHPDDKMLYVDDIRKVFCGESTHHACQYRAKNIYGEYVWVECKGKVVRKSAGENIFAGMITRLDNQSIYDSLTGLKTKLQFYAYDYTDESGVVCLFEIDYFRKMSNNYGYDKMDEILVEIGKFLASFKDMGVTAYRFVEDQFVCILPDQTLEEAEEMFVKLNKEVGTHTLENGVKIAVSYSAAAICYPIAGETGADDIVNRLEMVLSYAKAERRGKMTFYTEEISNKELRRKQLKLELSESISNDFEGFELFYQPWMSETGERIVGCEALLRWKGRTIKDSYPGEFIPLLEESDEIIEVGRFVMREAMRQQKEWEKTYGDIIVSFNVSYHQFLVEGYADEMKQVAEEYDVNPQQMVIELTESRDVDSPKELACVFEELRGMGFRIVLDDFGTGYASMEMLKKLPCDGIKIEHSFVRELSQEGHQTDFAIIKSILYLCSELGHQVVVEGVENEEVDTIIKSMKPGYLQGYYYSKPVCKSEFEELLQKLR